MAFHPRPDHRVSVVYCGLQVLARLRIDVTFMVMSEAPRMLELDWLEEPDWPDWPEVPDVPDELPDDEPGLAMLALWSHVPVTSTLWPMLLWNCDSSMLLPLSSTVFGLVEDEDEPVVPSVARLDALPLPLQADASAVTLVSLYESDDAPDCKQPVSLIVLLSDRSLDCAELDELLD